MKTSFWPIGVVLTVVVVVATPAAAQPSRPLVIGATFGDYHTTADHTSGSTPAVGAVVSYRVRPTLSIETEFLRPNGVIRHEYTGTSIAFVTPATPGDFVVTRFVKERRTTGVFSVGVSLHPAELIGRWSPQLFVGVTNHRVEDRTVLDHVSLPAGISLDRVNRAMSPDERWQRTLGSLTVGGSVALRLTNHLSVAPGIRYDYGSIGDEINNALRMSMRVLWRF